MRGWAQYLPAQLQNPWADLPAAPPYIAPCDREVLERHPQARDRLNLKILPYPFQGARDADVLFLLANPGAGELPPDYPSELVEERRRSLTFSHRRDPRFATPTWWHKRLRKLIEAVGEDAVSSMTLSVEYFPYHSRRYRRFPEPLPSQEYSFGLVREAIGAEKLIVVVRRKPAWLEAVPELREVDYIEVRNPRSAYISPGNLRDQGFARIVDRLLGGGDQLSEGTFLTWLDAGAHDRRLGVVVPPITDEMVYVLVADEQGNTDVEVFVARPEATGVSASELVKEQMRVVDPPEDSLTDLLIDLAVDYADQAASTERAARTEQDATPLTEPMDGYCVKERKMVRIKDARRVTTMDGRSAVEGICPDCGIRIWKIFGDG